MQRLWIDTETYSETPIKNGTYAYAADAEIMILAWAIDDGPVQVNDLTKEGIVPKDLMRALMDPSVLICAHNSMFDRTIFRLAKNTISVFREAGEQVERWRDTYVQALAHSLPGGLDKLGVILNLPEEDRKHEDGKKFIQLFCKPRPKNSVVRRATQETHPDDWTAFLRYAGNDIRAMRRVHARLPTWNYSGEELALWHLDQRINDRGVAIDLDLARGAVRAVERAKSGLASRTSELTSGEVESATRRDAMLAHVLSEYGVALPDMQASTLERRIADPDLPEALRELLSVRLQSCTTSTTKYQTLLKGTSKDGRLRGLLQFCGASRTGRWAGRLFQPQNLPRISTAAIANWLGVDAADVKKEHVADYINTGIRAIKADGEDLVFEDVMALSSNLIRSSIVCRPGNKLVVADLSNIEGRVLAWLAGEDWKLQAFKDYDTILGHDEKGKAIRKGLDLYVLAYANSFGVSPSEVGDDQRQIGKVQELALGYEGGVGAFVTFAAAYGINLEELARGASVPQDVFERAREMLKWHRGQLRDPVRDSGLSESVWLTCESLKIMWRDAHPMTKSLWGDLRDAVKNAVNNPGKTFVCRKLKCRRDGAWLRIVLPSGRALCYPNPKVDDGGKISYMGQDQYSHKWVRIYTYGGKLVENVTQAVARDVMAQGMAAAEVAGYEIGLTVHDELITEAPDTALGWSDWHLSKLMATNPPWAEGLPLAAAGFEAYRYKKG